MLSKILAEAEALGGGVTARLIGGSHDRPSGVAGVPVRGWGHANRGSAESGWGAVMSRPSAEDRMVADFVKLTKRAQELAESWVNGNRSYVLDTLESCRRPTLALLVAQALDQEPMILARELYRRSWDN